MNMAVWTAKELKTWPNGSSRGDGWYPARPEGPGTLGSGWQRAKAAWGVLTSRYDAVDWEGH